MMVFLVIVSLYGGIERIQMADDAVCSREAAKFNNTLSNVARAFCIRSTS